MKKIIILTALVALISITENINAGFGKYAGVGALAGVTGYAIGKSGKSKKRSKYYRDREVETVKKTINPDGSETIVTTYYS